MGEEEKLEGGEVGERWEGSGETVAVEAENTEVSDGS